MAMYYQQFFYSYPSCFELFYLFFSRLSQTIIPSLPLLPWAFQQLKPLFHFLKLFFSHLFQASFLPSFPSVFLFYPLVLHLLFLKLPSLFLTLFLSLFLLSQSLVAPHLT